MKIYMCWKSNQTEAVHLPRKKWIMNEILIFYKIITLAFNTLIQLSFPLAEAPFKSFILHGLMLHYNIFDVFCIPKSFTVKMNFQFSMEGTKLA